MKAPLTSTDITALALRSQRVALLRKLLPVAAGLLLVALVAVPSLRESAENRVSYHVQTNANGAPTSKLEGAAYHGTDQQGQPYTVTANTAVQTDLDSISLSAPIADITLKSGAWLMLKSDAGLFHEKADQIGLSGNVTFYRNDGTTMTAPTAQIDLRAGAASTTDPVQAQGPFGTLTAAGGFSMENRGANINFAGPATLTLIQAQ